MNRRSAVLVAAVCLAGTTACGGPKEVTGASPITTSTSGTGTSGAGSTTSGPASTGDPAAPTVPPFQSPSTYQDKSWTYAPESNEGVFTAALKVPQGWAETKRETYWSDFLDPTGQVRLRADVTSGLTTEGLEQSTAKAAEDELGRLRSAPGFKLLGQRTLPPGGQTHAGAAEIVYQFSRDGQTVQCTYRFIGVEDITQARLGIYYPASEQRGAEDVLSTVQDSLLLTD